MSYNQFTLLRVDKWFFFMQKLSAQWKPTTFLFPLIQLEFVWEMGVYIHSCQLLTVELSTKSYRWCIDTEAW